MNAQPQSRLRVLGGMCVEWRKSGMFRKTEAAVSAERDREDKGWGQGWGKEGVYGKAGLCMWGL